MKKGFIFFFILMSMNSFCQNEFAAASFYDALKKLQQDGVNGFSTYKGVQLKSEFEEINDEFRAKLLLPLADSGKIVIPENGNPYALYFFEAEKKKEQADARALNLLEALVTAHSKPLYAKTITTTVKDKIYSDTYLYSDEHETHASKALMQVNVFHKKDKYHLTLKILGEK